MRTYIHTIASAATLLIAVTAGAQNISLSSNADQIWRGTQQGARAGFWLDLGAVSAGDNRSDMIIGAPGSATVTGHVYVIFGGPPRTGELSLANADAILDGAAAGDSFGFSTAAGNVITPETSPTRNLVVGAPDAMGGRGAVYVFLGGFALGDHLTTASAVYRIIGNPGDRLGTALATADLDNNGFREIIIGAGGNDRIYVISGSASLSGTRDLAVTPAALTIGGVGLGDVLAAGDVTGDGISDLLAGSDTLNVVYLYKGRATGGLPTTPDAGFNGGHVGDGAGSSIRLLDIDHDGIRDVIIGAPGMDGPAGNRTDAGAVYLLWGGPSLASRVLTLSDVTFHGAVPGLKLGTNISAGDVNRDAPSDIVMMGPGSSGSAGELDIYYGRSVRTAYGVDPGNGLRLVDFADPANIDRVILGDPALGAIKATGVFEVTGEGARDIVASVPSEENNTGAVYFTISPSLVVTTDALPLVVNRGAAVDSSVITVNNRSIEQVTWSATSNQPWLTATPASGASTSATPGTLRAHADAAALAPGTYTGVLTVQSTSKHLEMFETVVVNLIVTDTRIAVDTPGDGATVTQPFTMSGWAIDTGATANTGVDAVHVYAFRSGGAAQFVGVATYGSTRSDVAAIFGPQFAPSGFSLNVAGLAPGAYRLIAYAHQSQTSTFTATAARDVTVAATGALWIDAPAASATVTSAFEVGGWAIDPAATTGTGVNAVQFYIFPNDGAGSPVFLGAGSYGWSRPDVAAAFGSQFNDSGYHFTVTGMMPGSYLLGVYARSTVSNAYSIVKTVHITVSATALMSIDTPSPEMVVTTPTFGVSGWAIDRNAATGTGVDALHVYAYRNPQTPGGGTPVFLGVATLGIARSDVGSLYGARFTNSGYVLNLNAAAAGLTPGVYNIVVWAHSTATDSFNNVAVVRIWIQ
jgi:hypothetical protein